MGNCFSRRHYTVVTGSPVQDEKEAYLLLLAALFCNQAYKGEDDVAPSFLLETENGNFPEIAKIRQFKSFETGHEESTKGIGHNRAIAFIVDLPEVQTIGLSTNKATTPLPVAVISIRGTATKAEISQDVQSVVKSPVTSFKRHAGDGFAKAFTYLCEKGLLSYAKELVALCGGRALIVGHSLGGAVGHLLAIEMRATLPRKNRISLITFGQPRVLSTNFAQKTARIDMNYKRVINTNDPIPRVPFATLGFKHTGVPCIYEGDESCIWVNFPANFDMNYAENEFGFLSIDGPAHKLDEYIERLHGAWKKLKSSTADGLANSVVVPEQGTTSLQLN